MKTAAASSKDSITAGTIDEGPLRELGQLSLSDTPSETYCDRGHAESTLQGLLGCFRARELCDVTLIAGECRISAHKAVLASSSKFFKAMLAGGLEESQLKEVPMGEHVDSRALEAIVQYCYSGTIELRADTVEMLLSTANRMQFERVANACSTYLQKHLCAGNCLRIALLDEQQFCKELHEQALKYTIKHSLQVMKQQEFLALQPDQLTSLLTSADLDAATVQSAFECLIAWVQHDAANREQHLVAALKLLKLHLLPPEYLLDNVERACSHLPECLPLIVGALKRRLLPEPPTGASSSAVGRLYAIGGGLSEMNSICSRQMFGPRIVEGPMSIEMYSAESNSWHPVQGVKGAWREGFGAVVLHGRVVVVGGRDNYFRPLNTVESFELSDSLDGDWEPLAPMNTDRHSMAAAVLGYGPDATVYVVGGTDADNQSLRSVERWDARAGVWTLVAPMKEKRTRCGLAALRGRLYAVGGWNDTDILDSVECYDPNTNRWSHCEPMSRGRSSVIVCAAGGYLYAIGGWNCGPIESVERYDPVADTWVVAAPLSCERAGVASCLMGDRIVAVGGGKDDDYGKRTVEAYNLASDSWQELAPLNTARSNAVLVHVPPC